MEEVALMRRIMRSVALALVLAAMMLATMAMPAFAAGPPLFAQGPPEGTVTIIECGGHGVAVITPSGETRGACH
jgi:hypothetical protein